MHAEKKLCKVKKSKPRQKFDFEEDLKLELDLKGCKKRKEKLLPQSIGLHCKYIKKPTNFFQNLKVLGK